MKASTVLAVFATALLSNATPTPQENAADAADKADGGPLSYGGGPSPPPPMPVPVQPYGPPPQPFPQPPPPGPVPFPPSPVPGPFPPGPGPFPPGPFPPPGPPGPFPIPPPSGGNTNPCGNNQVASCCNGNAGSGGLLGPILGGNCGILGQHPCSQGGSACCTTTQSGLINLALPCKLFDSLL